jgi:hypothetical protein
VFVERPDYEVVDEYAGFELRRYPPYIVAETLVRADFEGVGERGFPVLADYIGGNNAGSEEISMTSPVNMAPAGQSGDAIDAAMPVVQSPDSDSDDAYWLSFIMPAHHTMESLPAPSDRRIRLRRVDERLMAALRYSGTWSRQRYRRREQKLLQAVRDAGLEPVGEPVFARYDPPLTPWLLRRNEVLVQVERPAD